MAKKSKGGGKARSPEAKKSRERYVSVKDLSDYELEQVRRRRVPAKLKKVAVAKVQDQDKPEGSLPGLKTKSD